MVGKPLLKSIEFSSEHRPACQHEVTMAVVMQVDVRTLVHFLLTTQRKSIRVIFQKFLQNHCCLPTGCSDG